MTEETTPALRPDLFGQLAATDPHHGRARRLFERGQVLAVNGNQADLRVGYDTRGNPLDLKEVPIISGYVPQAGDWVAIQYEAGHSGAPWVTGPSMAVDSSADPAGIGVFSVSAAEPSDPQRSTVYFDESLATWRGWDGADWVELPSRLHNALADLQGGVAGEYYHFSSAEHGALHDLYDGDGMASAWIRRLSFKAIDASGTERTRLFEKDGDFFWAINAAYDEETDTWNRVDAAKHAYLTELRSKNPIASEPLGGIVWWRAVPGDNPIGDYGAVGGWELGFMMTEHRNYVMGGINLEIDGSGSPPYGRLTHLAGNDPAGDHTLIQHNSWYEGTDSWGRDNVDDCFAYGVDGSGDWLWWHYPSAGSSPWNTADWDEYARMHISGSLMARLDVSRRTGETTSGQSSFLAKHITSGDMADGLGAGYSFAIEDATSGQQIIAAIYAVRDGADNAGRFEIRLASAGSLGTVLSLTAAGALTLNEAYALPTADGANGQAMITDGAGAVSWDNPTAAAHASSHEVGGSDLVNHDHLTGFVANEHVDWTASSQNFSTSGTLHVGGAADFDGDVDIQEGKFAVLYSEDGSDFHLGKRESGGTSEIALRSVTNPPSGGPLFTVESQGYSQRLRVEHDGFLGTSNSKIGLNYSGGGSFADTDGYLYFASDAYLFWDESEDYLKISKPAMLEAGKNLYLNGSTTRGIFPSTYLELRYDGSNYLSMRSGTDFWMIDGSWRYRISSTYIAPYSDGACALGSGTHRWLHVHVTGGYYVDGLQVVGAQQGAIAGVPTAPPSPMSNANAINSILAALRTHGLIAT